MTLAEANSSDRRAPRAGLRAFRMSGTDDPFLDALPPGGAFQSRSFLAAIAETLCPAMQAELVLIGVEDDAGRPVAFFPFARRRRLGATVIEAVDFDVTDYFAPTIVDGDIASADIWRAVLRALPRADAIAFKKLPRDMHGRSHALSDAPFLKPMGTAAYTAPLRDSADRALDPTALPVARDVRRKLRKLQSLGHVTFTEATTPDEVARALDTLFDFRVRRFEGLSRRDVLTLDAYRDFYRQLTSTPERLGRLFTLAVDGEAVAVICALVQGDTVTLIIPSMSPDEKWQAASPGLVALNSLLEWAVAGGYRIFDFSVGTASYKARFDARKVELFEYQRALTPLGLPIVIDAALRRTVRHLRSERSRLGAFLRHARLLPSLWLVDLQNLILLPLAI